MPTVRPTTTVTHLVIGAGSAGCVLAHRLGEDPANRVLVLEAGGDDVHPFIRMPAALSIPMNSRRWDWGYHSEPEPGLDGRRLHCPRGRLLGGSSSINGMVCVRGHARDFDGWAAAGATGWDFASVLPYFRRAETFHAADGSPWPDDGWRGTAGPLATRRGAMANPLYRAFVEAAVAAGHPASDDLNGAQQHGAGAFDMTVHRGMRNSTARAYLDPARQRGNAAVWTRAQVRRLLLDGDRIIGAEGTCRGRPFRIHADAEVLLSAGAINSPLLLMHSGIGPADHLRAVGIDVRHDLPGVGANLQDHLEVYVQQACDPALSLNRDLTLVRKGLIGARWLLTRDGPGATNHFEAGAFLKSGADPGWPDIQVHFLPAAMRYDGRTVAAGGGFQGHTGPMLPASRGHIRLRDADPRTPPAITFNYLTETHDRAVFRAAVRTVREIFASAPLAQLGHGELQPGAAIDSDADLDAWIRQHCESAYHPCGGCRMGAADGADAVVDPHLRLRGLAGLRVVDSSVFPRITNGNLNMPTIMLAERAADLVRGRVPEAAALQSQA